MIRIKITDFQSIETVELEISGFAALVGRSNIGKSAIIRAVHAALVNEQGTHDVRHGPACLRRLKGVKTCKCQSSVRIVGPGFDILWEKGDAVNRYTVNGTVYDAVPKGFPDFLKPWFSPIKVGDKSMMLQVASQWDPLFLLDASGSAVADVLSDVAQLDRINVASRFVDKDRRDVLTTLKVREKDIQRVRDDLSGYVGLDGVVQCLETMTTRSTPLLAAQDAVRNIRRLLGAHRAATMDIAALEPSEALAVPGKVPLARAAQVWSFLQTKMVVLAEQQQGITALEPVDSLEVPNDQRLTQMLTVAQDFLGWLDRLRAIKQVFTRFDLLRNVDPPDAVNLQQKVESAITVLDFADQFSQLDRDILSVGTDLHRLQQEEDKLHTELGSIKICPLCEQPFKGPT